MQALTRRSEHLTRTSTNQTQLFEAALGIKAPWYVQGVDFGAAPEPARQSFQSCGSSDTLSQRGFAHQSATGYWLRSSGKCRCRSAGATVWQ